MCPCVQKLALYVVFGTFVLFLRLVLFLPLLRETCNFSGFSVINYSNFSLEALEIYLFVDGTTTNEPERSLRTNNHVRIDGIPRNLKIRPLPEPPGFSAATGENFEELSLREKYTILRQEYEADKQLLKDPTKHKSSKQPTIYDLELRAPQSSGSLFGGFKREVAPAELDLSDYESKKLWETTNTARTTAVDKLSSNMDPETLIMLGKGASVAGGFLNSMIGGAGGAAVADAMNRVGQSAVQRAEKIDAVGNGKYLNYLTGLPCQPAANKHWCLPEPVTTTSTYPPSLYELRKHTEKKLELEEGRRRNEQYLEEIRRNPFVDPVDQSEFESFVNSDSSDVSTPYDDYDDSGYSQTTHDEMLDSQAAVNSNKIENNKLPNSNIKINSLSDIDDAAADKDNSDNMETRNPPVEKKIDETEMKTSVELFIEKGEIYTNNQNKNLDTAENGNEKLSAFFVPFADFDLSGNSSAHAATNSTNDSISEEEYTHEIHMTNRKAWRKRNSGEGKEKARDKDRHFDEDEPSMSNGDSSLKKNKNVILVGHIPKEEISVFTPDELSLTAPTPTPPTPKEIARVEQEKRKQDKRDIRIERAVNQYAMTYADELRKATTYPGYIVQDSAYSGSGEWQNEVRQRVKEERKKDRETKKADYLRDLERQKIEDEAEKHRLMVNYGGGKSEQTEKKSFAFGTRAGENSPKGDKQKNRKDIHTEKIFRTNDNSKGKEYEQNDNHFKKRGSSVDERKDKDEKGILIGKDLGVKEVSNIIDLSVPYRSVETNTQSSPRNPSSNLRQNVYSSEENFSSLPNNGLSSVKKSHVELVSSSTAHIANTPIETLLEESIQIHSSPFTSSWFSSGSLRGFSSEDKNVSFQLSNKHETEETSSSLETQSKSTSRFIDKCLLDCRRSKNRRTSFRENDVSLKDSLRYLRPNDEMRRRVNEGKEINNQGIEEKLRAGETNRLVKKNRARNGENLNRSQQKTDERREKEHLLQHTLTDEGRRRGAGGGGERGERIRGRYGANEQTTVAAYNYLPSHYETLSINEEHSIENSSNGKSRKNKDDDNIYLLRLRREGKDKQDKDIHTEKNGKNRSSKRRTEELDIINGEIFVEENLISENEN